MVSRKKVAVIGGGVSGLAAAKAFDEILELAEKRCASNEFSNAAEPVTLHIITHTPELILARPELGIQYHLQGDMAQTLLALPVDKQETDTLSVTPLSQ